MGVMEISAVFSGIVISHLGESRACILGAGLAGLGLLLSSFSSGSQHARESVRKRYLHVLRIHVYIYGLLQGVGHCFSTYIYTHMYMTHTYICMNIYTHFDIHTCKCC